MVLSFSTLLAVGFCSMVRTTLTSDWKNNLNVKENSTDVFFDLINASGMSEDLKSLNDSLKELRDFIAKAEESHAKELSPRNLSDDKDMSNEHRDGHLDNDVARPDKVSPDDSKSMYKRAKAMLNSSLVRDKAEAYAILSEASELGDEDATAELAWGTLLGVHLPLNVSKAVGMFECLALEGHPEGHTGKAFLHAVGLGLAKSEEKALLHFTLGALGGSPWARMALGYRYLYGISVVTDCSKAVQYYRLVADSVAKDFRPSDWLRNNRISIPDRLEKESVESFRDVRDYYEMIAINGDMVALFALGHMYYYGTFGLERDPKLALHYFQQAARRRNAEALGFIGKIYLEGGENINVDLQEAYVNFEKAAQHNNPVGEAGLGMMYLEGKFVEKDLFKGLHFLTRSAKKGWVDGLVALGKVYYQGLGTFKDLDLARQYFLMASQTDHTLALYHLGQMHEAGEGLFQSCYTAAQFYKTVAERGSWDRLFVDAYGKFKRKDYREAFIMYALLAEVGFSSGQVSAALILDDFPLDLPFQPRRPAQDTARTDLKGAKAFQYWNRAMRQGESRAYLRIGDHYYYGRGVELNYEAAFLYYRYAAMRHNSAEAMFNLGFMHERGVGLQRDANLADRWYNMALDISEDSWLPIRLALVKLNAVRLGQNIANLQWSILFMCRNIFTRVIPYWDIGLIIILGTFVAYLIRCRLK